MQLSHFLYNLLYEGKVNVQGKLVAFTNEDLQQSGKALQEYYNDDVLMMPYTAPAYQPVAAIWAAKYLYTAIQLTVLRDLDEYAITQNLATYQGEITACEMYSADLVLRQLPHLYRLAKGLAPGDLLVKKLNETAVRWPLSSVGMQLDAIPDETVIFANPSLCAVYIDRIIACKDKQRLTKTVLERVKAATGDFVAVLWPELHDYTLNEEQWKQTTTLSQ